MRATVFAIGLRGDVEPAVALAGGLRDAGLDVRCAVQADFEEAATRAGLATAPVTGRSADFFGGAAGAAARDRLRTPRAFRSFFDNYLARPYARMLDDLWAAARDADVVVTWPWMRMAPALAEALRAHVIVAGVYPTMYFPTEAFANPYQPGEANDDPRRSWSRALRALAAEQPVINAWRRRALGLEDTDWRTDLRRLRGMPHLLGFSEAVLPRPADWPAHVHVTGYWRSRSDAAYEPPPALERFLAAGPAPIVAGFSSQVGRRRDALTRAIVDGLREAGARGVLLTGFGGLGRADLPPHVHAEVTAPHDWLFARAAGVIHHGGSGSTAAALAAGVPSVAVPFGYDQPLWGERLEAIGAGPAPIDPARLDASSIARAVSALTGNAEMRERAAAIAAVLRREDGVANAVARILAIVKTPARTAG